MQINSVFYSSRDGLKLHVRDYAPINHQAALPLICLPGLSRNARDFDLLAKSIAGDVNNPRRVVAFDYRGRGLSEYDKNHNNYNVVTEAEDVLAGLAALGIEHGIVLGTSRGGLISFVLAGMRPTMIKAVILNDIGPVIEGAGLMQIRGYLERAPKPKTWAEAIQTQKTIMAKNFPALTDDDWKFEAESRYSFHNGILKADYDPKLVLTMKSLNAGDRLPTAWPQFVGLTRVPMLVIRGENSNILSEATVARMSEVHPRMETMTIQGQGHAPMLHTAQIPATIAAFCRNAEKQAL
ncbi:MAG: alpha/beta hydrolase [Ahrensia sp.]|nr:alpha/beta hydrolase [Ahrensia sp.]